MLYGYRYRYQYFFISMMRTNDTKVIYGIVATVGAMGRPTVVVVIVGEKLAELHASILGKVDTKRRKAWKSDYFFWIHKAGPQSREKRNPKQRPNSVWFIGMERHVRLNYIKGK